MAAWCVLLFSLERERSLDLMRLGFSSSVVLRLLQKHSDTPSVLALQPCHHGRIRQRCISVDTKIKIKHGLKSSVSARWLLLALMLHFAWGKIIKPMILLQIKAQRGNADVLPVSLHLQKWNITSSVCHICHGVWNRARRHYHSLEHFESDFTKKKDKKKKSMIMLKLEMDK